VKDSGLIHIFRRGEVRARTGLFCTSLWGCQWVSVFNCSGNGSLALWSWVLFP